MKIAVIADDYPSVRDPLAGVFISARTRVYVDRGHAVRVYSTGGHGMEIETSYDEIPVMRHRDASQGAKDINSWSPDVVCVHAPAYGQLGYSLVSQISFPTLAWVHGYEALMTAFFGYHVNHARQVASIPRDIYRLYRLGRLLRRLQGVVFVSKWMQATAEKYLLGYHHQNTFVIPNPVDTGTFVPRSIPLIGPPKGLCVRSLGNWKYGIDTAIRAFSGMTETNLTVVGDGALRGVYEQMIEEFESNVTLVTKVYPHSKMPAIYPEYDYFVAPSRTEAQGVAMCEAMSCGLPVVACNAGGIPEFIDDGVDGYLVQPNNYRLLSERVSEIAADRGVLSTMGRRAREHVMAKCSKDVVAEMEEAAMRSAIRAFGGVH